VPKKLFVYAAAFSEDLNAAQRLGWDLGSRTFDWARLRDRVSAEVARVEAVYAQALARHEVDVFKERAAVVSPHAVRLASGRELSAGKLLIATGARPVLPTFPGAELTITSNEVFDLDAFPRRLVVAGAGYIANEFAGVFHSFGARVTLVNRGDTVLRGYDADLSARLCQISRKKGIDLRLGTSFESITKNDDGSLRVTLAGEGAGLVEADVVLCGTGRAPNVAGLGLEAVGVELAPNGAVCVDADSRSSVEGIYAVGDVTDRVQLTPVAVREGQAFADTVFGNKPTRVEYECIPAAVFTQPPLAAVGLTEAQARHRFGAIRIHTADFRPMKNVLAGRDERAFYKMIVDAATDVVVGLHMIGPDAPEILQAAAVAVKAKLTKADFDATIALHPSMAEELVLMS
jgi:glutathione reductase (NADPH)